MVIVESNTLHSGTLQGKRKGKTNAIAMLSHPSTIHIGHDDFIGGVSSTTFVGSVILVRLGPVRGAIHTMLFVPEWIDDDGTLYRVPPAYAMKAGLREGDLMQVSNGSHGFNKFKKMRP